MARGLFVLISKNRLKKTTTTFFRMIFGSGGSAVIKTIFPLFLKRYTGIFISRTFFKKGYFRFLHFGLCNMSDTSNYIIPNSVPVCKLDCKTAFDGLTEQEKKYAHFLSLACNQGGLVVLLQTSPESPAIFMLLQRLFSEEPIEDLKKKAITDGSITDDDFQALLTYAAGFYSNMGNYKSFGDTKIIPGIPKDKFQSIIWSSQAFQKHEDLMKKLWQSSDAIYSLNNRRKELGIGEKGLSTYYSSNITTDDIALVQEFMTEKNISAYNTRLFKSSSGNVVSYELRLASSATSDKSLGPHDKVFESLGKTTFKGHDITVTRGDYSYLLKRVVDNLNEAKKFAANENEKKMIENYAVSFETGSIDSHKDGSRYWIKDKGPVVESYIGFIESYRDPYGVRGEFEGFVSMVNKAMSEKFGVLVSKAEELLKFLPWPAEYEKDVFLRPDFTSLDILIFAGSGIPAGINIPNYDEIRLDEGFKNVSLGNVLQAHTKDQVVTFLSSEDQDLYSKLKSPSFEVQVGLHELLGHGSGKLFQEDKDGVKNFNAETLKHLETQEKITSWYKHGETWDSKFTTIGSSYEECRAECVGLHLCQNRDILRIFGHEGDEAKNIMYINWLNMVRAGLLGLEFYSPETGSWKQAHMNARFVILQVLLEAGDEFVTIKSMTGADGEPDLIISMDKEKIETTGRNAIAKFLMRLQLYKATADVEAGEKMYKFYSTVSKEMLERRKIVLARKQPRRIFVQSNTRIEDDKVMMEEYPGEPWQVIYSFTRRYPEHDSELEKLWQAEQSHHTYAV